MLDTFDKQFKSMTPSVQADKMVSEIREGFKKIKPLVDSKGNDSISQKTVSEINEVTTALVKLVAP